MLIDSSVEVAEVMSMVEEAAMAMVAVVDMSDMSIVRGLL